MFKVYVTDGKSKGYDWNYIYFNERHVWAVDNCKSYRGHEVIDVSDTSLQWDQVAEYLFEDEKDVNWFKLRWD